MKPHYIGNGGHYGNLSDMDIECDEPSMVIAFCGMDCEKLEERCKLKTSHDCLFPNIIHPSAVLSPAMSIGDACHIMAGAIIQHDAKIGSCCIINTRAVIEHNAAIGNGCHIAPGAIVLGGAKVGEYCFIGAGAIVVQGCAVPPRTFVKAGTIWKQK